MSSGLGRAELELEIEILKARAARIVRKYEEDQARRLRRRIPEQLRFDWLGRELFARSHPNRAEVNVLKTGARLHRLTRDEDPKTALETVESLRRAGWKLKLKS